MYTLSVPVIFGNPMSAQTPVSEDLHSATRLDFCASSAHSVKNVLDSLCYIAAGFRFCYSTRFSFGSPLACVAAIFHIANH
ncbi:MAG: hypothetical protein JSC085_000669 [Candidatus Tokpelaia sp. JSC085]|nr:MAG: hypothetical protein JSC085_000669 [Candidatus Tokpelaia sp. JSC085]